MNDLFRLIRNQGDTIKLTQAHGVPVFSVPGEDVTDEAEVKGLYRIDEVVAANWGYEQGWTLTLFQYGDEEHYKIWMPKVRKRDSLIMPVPKVGDGLDRAGNGWAIYSNGKVYPFPHTNMDY